MVWTVCLIITGVILITSILLSVCRCRINGRIPDPVKILFAGIALALVCLSLPSFIAYSANNDRGLIETIFLSVHNMLLFFVVGTDIEALTSYMVNIESWQYSAYSVCFSVLLVVAPVLTFSFVLSFFKNASAYQKYLLNFRDDVYVFTELNERSLALANSLGKKKKRLLVFTNVKDGDGAVHSELIHRAENMGAICFRGDSISTKLGLHNKKSTISFFAIGEDQSENLSLGLKIISQYGRRENTNLYIFSTQAEAEFLLLNAYSNADELKIRIKVRNINEVQSLILRTLYDDGYEVFQSAYPQSDGMKQISAVIVGLGAYGTEMAKALPWFCQMDGYSVSIDIFDESEDAELNFTELCPELMDPKYNGNTDDGEAMYDIRIHSGTAVDSHTFSSGIQSLSGATYVFVALDNDESNIAAAAKLRGLFERMGLHPVIKAIVQDSDKKEALRDIKNFKGQRFDIDFMGDIASAYSEDVILNSEAQTDALKRHMRWGKEEDFWRFSYNYRSSLASAIHKKMKLACAVPGADKAPEQRTEEELWAIRKLEHRRWNAYMRSEGYCYAPKRNDMAKQHHCLVHFDRLPLSEQIKDDD